MSQSEMLEAAFREYKPEQVQKEVLQILESGNEFLQELVDKFGETRSQVNKAQVACFFELKPSDVGGIVGGQARMVCLTSLESVCIYLSTTKADCQCRDLWSAKAQAALTSQTQQRSTLLHELTLT